MIGVGEKLPPHVRVLKEQSKYRWAHLQAQGSLRSHTSSAVCGRCVGQKENNKVSVLTLGLSQWKIKFI